jgi:uncharacterized protein (TIGR00730 family)
MDMSNLKRICVFCGSNLGARPEYREAAEELAQELVGRGVALVYGGASVGIMGVVADEVLNHGGEAIGIMPQSLVAKGVVHSDLTELKVVDSLAERKAAMVELSDAFVALPGGYGTLEELFEVITLAQLGLNNAPCGLLNVNGFYDPMLAFLDNVVAERFVRPEHRSLAMSAPDARSLLDQLESCEMPTLDKWTDR